MRATRAIKHALLAAVSRLLPDRAVVVLCGQPAEAPPLAPSVSAGQSPTARPPAWSSAACGRDAQADPPAGAGEPSLGYMRIQGELLQLGINVSATTVVTVLRVSGLGPAPRRIGPSWSEFLRAQAQSVLGAGLPSEPGGGLEGNVSARRAATPEGAPGEAEAEVGSTNDAEVRWPSWPVSGPPPLPAVAALPSPCDSTAAPRRSSQQWHARDGPSSRRRSLHTRTGRPGCQSRRLHARGVQAATTGRVPAGRCQTLHRPPSTTGRPPHRTVS